METLETRKKNENFQTVSECRINVQGSPLGFINIHSVAKYQKTRKTGPFETLKIFGKKSHSAEKNRKGDPLVSSGFLGYVKKVKKKERGTLQSQPLSQQLDKVSD